MSNDLLPAKELQNSGHLSLAFLAKPDISALLIVHSLQDPYLLPMQSEQLVEALRREGKTNEYVTYPDEGHGILRRKNLLDFYTRMERFLDLYLL